MNMPLTGAMNPMTTRNPFTLASVNPVNTRAPMNPFNPGFAQQRAAVMPTQPRPGMLPQTPQPPVTNQFQPMGFRGPIAQQRVSSGLSQLIRKPMFRRFAEGGSTFDPQGSDYDYQTALAYGMGPNGTGENQGHWGSVAPTSDDERIHRGLPEDSYVVLKGKNHKTFHKAENAENERGSKIVKIGDRYYSVPK